MAEENFKVGDKVKVVPNSPKFRLCGKRIWTVAVESPPDVIAYCSPNYRLFQRSDIKLAYQKDEQLLFSFMHEN
ncbi:MAG: hypothetical protein ABIL62_04285 [Planctomycetota bacterium]